MALSCGTLHPCPSAGIASAPLWDGEGGRVCGMLSASDFIRMLQRLRSVVSSSANPMSEQEMDLHTIRWGGFRVGDCIDCWVVKLSEWVGLSGWVGGWVLCLLGAG
jgi:hypothetical protein